MNIAIAPSNIVSVTWVLTNSAGVFDGDVLTNSPLGTNVPVYDVSTRSSLQVAGRTLLRPDLVGQYTVDRHHCHYRQRLHQPDPDHHRRHLHGRQHLRPVPQRRRRGARTSINLDQPPPTRMIFSNGING